MMVRRACEDVYMAKVSATKMIFLSSIKMALATMISRVLGLGRELLMAAYFGAGAQTDAFLVAYRIPNLLRDLFAEGAFSSAFVPNFVSVRENKGVEQARAVFWSSFCWLTLITGSIGLIIFFFAPELIRLFAPEYVSDPQKFKLTVELTKLMSPYLMFVSIAALFMGVLNSFKSFFLPGLAPAFFNIAVIICIVALAQPIEQRFNLPGIYAIAIGVVIGGLLQVFIQYPKLHKLKMQPSFKLDLSSPEVKKIFQQLLPGLVGFAATQVNLLVNTILATSTIVGAVSWLQYAFRLFQLPVGVLSVSIGNSNLVHFSEDWKRGEVQKAKETLKASMMLSLGVMLPVMFFMFFSSQDLIKVIFERGRFNVTDTSMTQLALQMYVIGLPFYGLHKILVPCFYSMDLHKKPMYSSIFSIGFNITFCTLLVDSYGFSVLALGTSISIALNFLVLYFQLVQKLNLRSFELIGLRALKLLSISALTFFILRFAQQTFIIEVSGFIESLVLLIGKTACFFIVYATFLVVAGEASLLRRITRRVKNS